MDTMGRLCTKCTGVTGGRALVLGTRLQSCPVLPVPDQPVQVARRVNVLRKKMRGAWLPVLSPERAWTRSVVLWLAPTVSFPRFVFEGIELEGGSLGWE